MFNKQRLLAFALGLVVVPAAAQDAANGTENSTAQSDAAAMTFVGDDFRIGVGYQTDTHLTGEVFWTFAEDSDSAWIAEGWLGDESAGGLKLNYHWLSGGVEAGLNSDGQPVYSDGKVRKLFLAADRNIFDDGKLTFGGGSERENRFWSLYGSRSTTGERFISSQSRFTDQLVNGFMNNHAFSRTDTLETITDFYAHPYDWGVGFRVGRYFDDQLVRARTGLDYESGDFGSSQVTAYAGMDKRFEDSAHGFSLRAEFLHKQGDFETDKSDFRVSAMWTWEFGQSFRPTHVYNDVPVERIPAASELPRDQISEVVQNRVTLDNGASFELDRYNLNAAAVDALQRVLNSLEGVRIAGHIQVDGHTCSLGTDEYNQVLSERRAKAVFDFLVAKGVDASAIRWQGYGEHQPRYSNDTEETRQHNRRVEISFTAEQEVVREVLVGEGQPITEWVQQKVPAEAAWIRRALRNPVAHKRSVDYYRINRVTENLTTGVAIFENTGPDAADDVYSVDQNSSSNGFNVLANDNDAEGDSLTIVSASGASHGTLEISGDQVLYTPDTDYFGSDQFSYTVDDGFGGMATAVVSVMVLRLNVAPLAADDQFVVAEDSNSNLLDVLANDTDGDGDSLSLMSVTTPLHGTAAINGNQVSYTPNPGFFGEDSFQYTIEDGFGGSATGQVSVTVEEVNDPPVAVDDAAQTLKNYSKVIDVLANDSDPNGDPLSIVEIIQSDHPMGFVVINPDQTLTYTPMTGWWGGDSFQYRISDGRGGSAVATVTMNVTTLFSKP